MKIALGMIIGKQEEPFLDKMLSIVSPKFDGIIIRNETEEWTKSYSEARNDVIDRAEKGGFEYIMFLDADECMFPKDIDVLRDYCEDTDIIGFPEIELAKDFEHFESHLYPDIHKRAFALNKGFRYEFDIHENLKTSPDSRYLIAVNCPIYHYGKCKPKELLLKKYNRYRFLDNLDPIDTDIFWKKNRLDIFHGDHPFKNI